MSNKFKVGDVVQLKSGGPAMTVVNVHPLDDMQIITCYFKEGDVRTGRWPTEALVIYEEAK